MQRSSRQLHSHMNRSISVNFRSICHTGWCMCTVSHWLLCQGTSGHQPYQDINYTRTACRTSIVPGHQPYQDINHTRTSTIPGHQPYQDINYTRTACRTSIVPGDKSYQDINHTRISIRSSIRSWRTSQSYIPGHHTRITSIIL